MAVPCCCRITSLERRPVDCRTLGHAVKTGAGEVLPFRAIAKELTDGEIAAAKATIPGLIETHLQCGYRDPDEISKRIDEGFIQAAMFTTGSVSLSKSGPGFGASADRGGETQRNRFEAEKRKLQTGLRNKVLAARAASTDTLARRLVRAAENNRVLAIAIILVGAALALRGVFGFIGDLTPHNETQSHDH